MLENSSQEMNATEGLLIGGPIHHHNPREELDVGIFEESLDLQHSRGHLLVASTQKGKVVAQEGQEGLIGIVHYSTLE